MNKVITTTIILAGLLLSACGGDSKTPPPTTTTTNTWVLCDPYVKWNAAVDEWNKLTLERDAKGESYFGVYVNGVYYEDYKDWAKAFGKPTEMTNECL